MARVRIVDDVGQLVKEIKRSFEAGEIALEGRRLPSNRFQRLVQLPEVRHHQEQVADGEHAGANVPCAEPKDGCRPRRDGQPDEQSVTALDQCEANPRPHPFTGAQDEPLFLVFLPPKRLDDAKRSQCFLHDGQR